MATLPFKTDSAVIEDLSAPVLVVLGPVWLRTLVAHDPNGPGFVQFFNTEDPANVTLGTTTPNYVLHVLALNPVHQNFIRMQFSRGVVVAATTGFANDTLHSGINVSMFWGSS